MLLEPFGSEIVALGGAFIVGNGGGCSENPPTQGMLPMAAIRNFSVMRRFLEEGPFANSARMVCRASP